VCSSDLIKDGVTQNLVGSNPSLCDRLGLPPGLSLSGT